MEFEAAISKITPLPDWDATFAQVNAWRGACLHHFSTVELAVTETLLALNEASPAGTVIRDRFSSLPPVRQR